MSSRSSRSCALVLHVARESRSRKRAQDATSWTAWRDDAMRFTGNLNRLKASVPIPRLYATMSKHLFSTFDVTKQGQSGASLPCGVESLLIAVFYSTKLSLALVNLKPLLPGRELRHLHRLLMVSSVASPPPTPYRDQSLTKDVLVLPRRVVPRLSELEMNEINDLFQSVQAVGKAVERAYKAEGLTISIQVSAAASSGLNTHKTRGNVIALKSTPREESLRVTRMSERQVSE